MITKLIFGVQNQGCVLRLFYTPPRSLLAIAVNASTLSFVELSFKKQQYHLLGYGLLALEEGEVVDNQIIDTEHMGQRIAALVARSKRHTKQAAMALATDLVITQYISLPNDFDEQDIEAQIRVDADQYIPYPLDEVSLDFEVLGAATDEVGCNEVLLIVARTEYVEQYRDALIFSGLKPKVIEVEAQATERALQLMVSGNINYLGTIALVDIGQSRTTVYIAQQGQFVYQLQQLFGDSHLTSIIATHYGLVSEEAEQAKLSPESLIDYDQLIFQPFIDVLMEYLTVAFEQYAATETSAEIEQVILCGKGSVLPQLSNKLQHQLSLPVSLANPFNSMSISTSIDTEQLLKDAPQLMTACGLGMRCRMVGY